MKRGVLALPATQSSALTSYLQRGNLMGELQTRLSTAGDQSGIVSIEVSEELLEQLLDILPIPGTTDDQPLLQARTSITAYLTSLRS